MSAPSRSVDVRGGTGGITATVHDIEALARLYGTIGRRCGEQATVLHRHLLDPGLVATTVLDPVGAAHFEAALLAALDGPHGLATVAAELITVDAELRGAALAYLAVDRLDTDLMPALDGLTGLPSGTAALVAGWRHDGSSGGVEELAAADPALADTTVDALSHFWSDFALITAIAVRPDGRAAVSSLGPDHSAPADRPPRSLRDLVGELARRNAAPTGGDIDVRFVYTTGPGGQRRRCAVVDIPGTKTWSASDRDPDPTNLNTNIKSITGARTSYEQGVLEAMRQAGVGRDEPVLMVGHSQGGMVAVNAAARAARTHEFTVTNILTAGSPIARLAVPGCTTVLSIENDGDVIPHCDGASNPDRVNLTTVRAHRNSGNALTNHDLDESYVPAAGDVDASDDPSVRSYLASLRPFLDGDAVDTEVYHVSRVR